jgi:hypothetical protein
VILYVTVLSLNLSNAFDVGQKGGINYGDLCCTCEILLLDDV